MTERWVCNRCFTSADPSAAACPNCGLARGAARPSAVDEVREGDAATSPPDQGNASAVSGGAGDGWSRFEEAKLDLAQTGTRRLFVCGRCGKGLSLAWEKCHHCQATFDEFPPIDTGQDVQEGHDIIAWFLRIAGWFR